MNNNLDDFENWKMSLWQKKIDVEDFFNGREQLLFLRESLIMFKIHHQSIGQFIGLNFLSFLLITFENKFQT